MKKIIIFIVGAFILLIFSIKTPGDSLQIRVKNSTDIDIFRLWLGRAEHSTRYFFRGDRSTVFEEINKGKTSDYENVFNTHIGLARINFNTLIIDDGGREKGILYRIIGGLTNNKLSNSSARDEETVLAPGKYTLEITGLIKAKNGNKSTATYRLVNDTE